MDIEELADVIAKSDCNVALTGAGVSTASGVRDFRGPQGIWRIIDPEKFEIDYFLSNPDEVWNLFVEHFNLREDVKPNPAHYALAELENMGLLCALITQNIDGLHQRAGSKNVIELHGNLRKAVCMSCGKEYDLAEVLSSFKGESPRCKACGGLLKPDIIFFGEPLKSDVLTEAIRISKKSKVFLAIGTSLAVSPANQLPLYAKYSGAKLIIINEGPTELDYLADAKINERVEKVLPELVKIIYNKINRIKRV